MSKYYKTKETAMKHLNSGERFSNVTFDFMRNNKEIVMYALAKDQYARVPAIFSDDKEAILAATKNNYSFRNNRRWEEVSPRLRNDRDVIMACIKNNSFEPPQILEHCDFNDREMVMTLLHERSAYFSFCPHWVKSDKQLIHDLIQKSGDFSICNDMTSKLRNDQDFMNCLMKLGHRAFQYASKCLRNDPEWFMPYLAKNPSLYKHLGEDFINDGEFALSFMEDFPQVYAVFSEKQKSNLVMARPAAGHIVLVNSIPTVLFSDEFLAKTVMATSEGDVYTSLPKDLKLQDWFLFKYLESQTDSLELHLLPFEVMDEIGYSGANWIECPKDPKEFLRLVKASRLSKTLEQDLPINQTKATVKI